MAAEGTALIVFGFAVVVTRVCCILTSPFNNQLVFKFGASYPVCRFLYVSPIGGWIDHAFWPLVWGCRVDRSRTIAPFLTCAVARSWPVASGGCRLLSPLSSFLPPILQNTLDLVDRTGIHNPL